MEVALRANVDVFEVSLPLLLSALSPCGGHDDVISACVRQGRQLGIIRPSTRLVIEAPIIAPELLIPLPKDTLLCRQPQYNCKKPAKQQTDPEITVHPQRDQIVALLMQREAQITASITKSQPIAPSGSLKAHIKTPLQPATRTVPAMQPDRNIARPPWAFLKPLVAEAALPKT